MTVLKATTLRTIALSATLALAAAAGGCSSDNGPGLFTTGAISTPPPPAPVKQVDPACPGLAAQIDKLRQDAAVGNLEKAADGKTATVKVTRASLATQSQLNKANAEFIAKCGPMLPRTAAMANPTPAPTAKPVAPQVAQAAVKPASAAGVTVAPSPAPQQ